MVGLCCHRPPRRWVAECLLCDHAPGGCSCKSNRSPAALTLGAHGRSLRATHGLTAHLAHPLGGHQRDDVTTAHDARQAAGPQHWNAADTPIDQQMTHVLHRTRIAHRDHRRRHQFRGGPTHLREQVELTDQAEHRPGAVHHGDRTDPVLRQKVGDLTSGGFRRHGDHRRTHDLAGRRLYGRTRRSGPDIHCSQPTPRRRLDKASRQDRAASGSGRVLPYHLDDPDARIRRQRPTRRMVSGGRRDPLARVHMLWETGEPDMLLRRNEMSVGGGRGHRSRSTSARRGSRDRADGLVAARRPGESCGQGRGTPRRPRSATPPAGSSPPRGRSSSTNPPWAGTRPSALAAARARFRLQLVAALAVHGVEMAPTTWKAERRLGRRRGPRCGSAGPSATVTGVWSYWLT